MKLLTPLFSIVAIASSFGLASCGSSDSGNGSPSGTGGTSAGGAGAGGAVTTCTTSGTCSSPTPYCVGGVCAQCEGDGNCAGFANRQHCSTTTHTCVQCAGDGDCANTGLPYCSPEGRCVECLAPGNCTGAGMTCDTLTYRCAPGCQSNADCSAAAGTPYCSTARGVCVECTGDGNCTANQGQPYCAPTGRCVECVSDGNCAGTGQPYCNTSTTFLFNAYQCVECLTLANCPTGCTACSLDHTCQGCP